MRLSQGFTTTKRTMEAMPAASLEQETMLPKSAAEESPSKSSCWWAMRNTVAAMILGFVLGVFVKGCIEDTSRIGPPCAELLPPDHLPRCPTQTTLPLAHREAVGAPLEYFNAGYTGAIGASDPRNFGPDAWRTLHRFSVAYPAEPDDLTKERCGDFLQGLPYTFRARIVGTTCSSLRCSTRNSRGRI
jgi:hypothetical protein